MDGKIKDELRKYADVCEKSDEIELEFGVRTHDYLSISVSSTENGQKVVIRQVKSEGNIAVVLNDGENGVDVEVGKRHIGTVSGYRIAEIDRDTDEKGLIVKLRRYDEKDEESGNTGTVSIMFPNAEVFRRVYSEAGESTKKFLEKGLKNGTVSIYDK